MAIKLVLVGPMDVGKSTLRKWLFEGESIFKLLENPLEPTYGVENYSYHLFLKDIGVFDLAGQENEKWFQERPDVFNESDLILNVLDARFAPKIISDKINLAYKVESKQAPQSSFFFLIHKIDLIDISHLEKIKNALKDKKLDIFYTSIKKDYLPSTIETFVEIFKRAGLEQEEKINFDLIKINIQLFHYLYEKKVLSFNTLMEILKIENDMLNSLIRPYIDAEFLKTKKADNEKLVFLLEKGEIFYNKITSSFEKIDTESQQEAIAISPDSIANYLYGIIISDMNGKTLLTIETEPDSLNSALNAANNEKFDIELIGMFLNALQKFSKEINVQNLSSFRVQGANLKITSISRKNLTLTLFTSPKIDTGDIKEDFDNLFDSFLSKYQSFLPSFNTTGNVSPFLKWIPEAKENMKNIIEKYKKTELETMNFDNKRAKKIYSFLNEVDDKNFELEKQLQFKNLKVKLLETIISENVSAFKNIEEELGNFVDIK
ncbi:MAG: GTPase domain-containing protein [Promethearchaeota archaeon]